jgi:hypothetical protein
MDGDEIAAALTDLAAEVDRRGIHAKIFVVGGTVMVLAFGSRTGTADVDSAASNPVVYEVAREVAERRGLPDDWINDAAKGFIPLAVEPDWQPVLAVGDVEIVAADEWTMLTMKMRASRTRDLRDIRFLLGMCGITNEHDALTLYREYFPEDPIEPRGIELLRTALAHNAEAAPSRDLLGAASSDLQPPSGSGSRSLRDRGMTYWFVAKRGRVAHVVRPFTTDHLVVTDCGKSFSMTGARMGSGASHRPRCAGCGKGQP